MSLITPPIPHMRTALRGPLKEIEKSIINQSIKIESWFRQQAQNHCYPLYGSVDLRNAGYKVAPVDTNLFPAGFNNLSAEMHPLCIQAMQHTLNHAYPRCRSILLLAETHTQHPMYYENISCLHRIVQQAGYNCWVGSLHPDLRQKKTIALNNGQLTLYPVVRNEQSVEVAGQRPCLIITNNDFSNGVPDALQNSQQAIIPHPQLGWHARKKTNHFGLYQAICDEFAELIGIPPWLINGLFAHQANVDFKSGQGLAELKEKTHQLLTDVSEQYRMHEIKDRPFAVIKANQGTYGMGIMMVHDASEIEQLNRKQKSRMASAKGGRSNADIIIQEGVYTHEHCDPNESVAEPVVYSIGQQIVGGFYRVHTDKQAHDNLNAPGMHFVPLSFSQACNQPQAQLDGDAEPNRFYTYGVIARLALLAAAKEQHDAS